MQLYILYPYSAQTVLVSTARFLKGKACSEPCRLTRQNFHTMKKNSCNCCIVQISHLNIFCYIRAKLISRNEQPVDDYALICCGLFPLMIYGIFYFTILNSRDLLGIISNSPGRSSYCLAT